jgi:hypothetical protein
MTAAISPSNTDFKKLWNSKEWKIKRADFLKGQVCQVCGRSENLVVCHDDYNLYNDLNAYLDFIYSAKVLCKSCNMAEMTGLELCKTCLKEKGEYHYPIKGETCKYCRSPEQIADDEQKAASYQYRKRQIMNQRNAKIRAIRRRMKVNRV